jgi:CheY-like chemotaxis protein
MSVARTVLVVSPTPSLAKAAVAAARANGYQAIVVQSFNQAKKHLGMNPQLLVTELKLGEFNGLHLALRAAASDIPAIVIADASFEHEVEHLGALWVSQEAAGGHALQTAMLRLVQGEGASRTNFGYLDGDHAESLGGAAWVPPSAELFH